MTAEEGEVETHPFRAYPSHLMGIFQHAECWKMPIMPSRDTCLDIHTSPCSASVIVYN